jgi:secondary thiamine-phosphate synthase enzyme
MMQFFKEIKIKTNGQKLIEITSKVLDIVENTSIKEGILNLSILHTSASLIVQENADQDVKKDLLNFFDITFPMDPSLYAHNIEGKDDMPAHIKTALTSTHITLSIRSKKLVLGTWQGIYLFEHRLINQNRTILAHILGN